MSETDIMEQYRANDTNFAKYAVEFAYLPTLAANNRKDYKKDLKYVDKAIEDPEARAKNIEEKENEYKDKFASPYQAANRGYIDDVIEPRNTRFRIIRALQQLQTKKLSNPAKKHDNLPL